VDIGKLTVLSIRQDMVKITSSEGRLNEAFGPGAVEMVLFTDAPREKVYYWNGEGNLLK